MIRGALQIMHRDSFDEENSRAIPSASLEDVFHEMGKSYDVQIEWLTTCRAELVATDAETQSMLGGVLNNLGFLQQKLGDTAAAATTYNEAIAAQNLAVQLAPEVKRYRQYLRKHKEKFRTVATEGTAS